MKPVSESDIQAAQAVYTPFVLKIYNAWVLDISNNWIWRCPKQHQLQLFKQNLTAHHLDIGVGTGYYLKQCTWPEHTELTLMDLNQNCLNLAKQAVSHLNPKLHKGDIFKPQKELFRQFDSISMNFLLHCLPGDMTAKGVAIANAVAMLKPHGVLFGSTIVSDDELHTPVSRLVANFYNKKSIFSNRQDTVKSLSQMLKQYLENVEIQVEGAVALFKGYCPA